MVDASRQVPSPSASAWLLEVAAAGSPRYVVLRTDEEEAREALAAYLADIGAVETMSIDTVTESTTAEIVAVVW